MEDEVFINGLLQKGREAKQKVRLEFSNISAKQLNWQSSPVSWSIAQCLDHLVVSHSVYFSELKKITDGNFKMSFWEKYSPFTKIWGNIMKDQMQEQVKRKLKAPAKIQPASKAGLEIVERYHRSLDQFLEYISNCRNIDIDKTIIASPIVSIVTYSLRDVLHFLITHEHRHINQAIRVKRNGGFPKFE
ncbi:MAG TPA: DinB family protein [Chitinophagaceae bacterium]|nr:DinB family protein [Chitinophagaceae bacterium]